MNVELGYHQKLALSWVTAIVLASLIGAFGPEVLRNIWFEIGLLALIICFYAVPPAYFLPGKDFGDPGLKMSDQTARREHWLYYGFTCVCIVLSVTYAVVAILLKLTGVWN